MASGRVKVSAISIAIIAAVLALGYTISDPQRLILTYVSSFGFLALFAILFILAIPILVKIRQNKFTVSFLVNRRWIGIWTFIFGLIHAVLVFNFFYAWDFAKFFGNPGTLLLSLGLVSLLILAAMAGTSNDTAVRKLGKNWKRLHNLLYLVLVLVVVHSFSLGKIFLSSLEGKVIVGVIALAIVIGKGWLKLMRKKTVISGERIVPKPSEAQTQQQPN